MLIQDFKITDKPLPRVRLHPHFACSDCRYVKELWRNNPEVRSQIVVNGIKPCKSRLKAKYMKQVPPKPTVKEAIQGVLKVLGFGDTTPVK